MSNRPSNGLSAYTGLVCAAGFAAFDVAAASLALWCTAAVLKQFDINALTHDIVRVRDVDAFLAAGVSYFVVSTALPGIARAATKDLRGRRFISYVFDDLPFRGGT